MTSRPARMPLLLAASLVVGLGYPLAWDAALPAPALIALKGAGVGLLAVLAVTRARSGDGWLLAAVMALGALGDILLELWFEAGVAAFGLGHLTAIALYWRNRRPAPTASQRLLALGLLLFGAVMPFILLGSDHPQVTGLAAYSLLLTVMAAAAWLSRFPRYRTGLGALLFVASDGLIAARMGPLAQVAWVSHAVWLTYYVGQLLIFLGVSARLEDDRR